MSDHPKTNSRLSLLFPTFILILIGLTIILAKRPFHNWDMIPYIACELEWEGVPKASLHKETYQILRAELSEEKFTLLTSGEYRERCYRDSSFFLSQLPSYRIKGLYIIVVMLARDIGFSYTFATRIPSLLGFISIAFLLWFWLGKILQPLHRFSLALVSIAMFPVTELARLSTPDGLAVSFLLCIFCFVEQGRRNIPLLVLFTLLATAVRVDYAIYGIVIFSSLAFLRPFRDESWLKVSIYISIIVLLILFSLLLGPIVGNSFDWLYSFERTGVTPGYINHLKGSLSFFNMTLLMIFLVIGVLALPLVRRFGVTAREKGMFLMIVLSMGLRLLAFPSFQERFFCCTLHSIACDERWMGNENYKGKRNARDYALLGCVDNQTAFIEDLGEIATIKTW